MIKDTSSQDIKIKMKPRYLQKIIAISLVSIFVIACAFLWTKSSYDTNKSINRDSLRIEAVVRGDLTHDVAFQGRVVAANRPMLYSPINGLVTFLAYPGDEVEKGQEIIKIDSPQLENQLQQAQKKLAQMQTNLQRKKIEAEQRKLLASQNKELAKLNFETAKREILRAQKSFEKKVMSEREYQSKHDELKRQQLYVQHAIKDEEMLARQLAFELKTQKFEVEEQELVINDLKRQQENSRIRAAFKGMIGDWKVEQSAMIEADQALMTLIDLNQLAVDIEIPEVYTDQIALSMQAEVNLLGENIAAKLISISPEISNNRISGRLVFTAEYPKSLRQNQRIEGRLLIGNIKNVLKVYRGDFLQSEHGRAVYQIVDDFAQRTPIQVGQSNLKWIEIKQGLKEGDKIVISNTEKFEQADKIRLF